MWLLFYSRTQIILAPDYQRYWSCRSDAYDWAEAQGYNLEDVLCVPVIWPEETGR